MRAHRTQQPRNAQQQAGSIGSAIRRPQVTQLPTNSRIHPINPPGLVVPLHLGSHAPSLASAGRRSQFHIGVFETNPKLPVYFWV